MYKKPTYEELEKRIEELEKEFHEPKKGSILTTQKVLG